MPVLARWITLTLLTGFFLAGRPAPAQKQRPNILLIMADDLGFSDLGCYGSEIKTPNLDRLAKGGMRLTQFYNAGRCCPSRASLLTGLYPHQAGMGDMNYSAVPALPAYRGYLSEHSVTIAEVLKAKGYRTYMSGKWHVGDAKVHWPQQRGFDRYFGLTDGAANYFEPLKPYFPRHETLKMVSGNQEWSPTAGKPFYMTTALTDSALAYLGIHGADSPFFLYLAYTAPHWPLHALPEDMARYRGQYKQGWDKLRQERYQRQQQLGIIDKKWPLSPRYSEQVPAWDSVPAPEKAQWSERMTVYAAMIDRMDREIGRLLDKLKATGADRNTLVLFLSDNGGCHEDVYKWGKHRIIHDQSGPTGETTSFAGYGYPGANVSNTPFRLFKHWTGEGGIASPLIAYFPPGIAAGQLAHQPAHITDLLATCADYAGAAYPQTYHGNRIQPTAGLSLRPVLAGRTPKNSNARDRPIFWEHEGNRAIRVGKWKLLSTHRNGTDGPWELYDMAADRTELVELSRRYPAVVNRLKTRYQAWADRVGVRSPVELDRLRQAMTTAGGSPK